MYAPTASMPAPGSRPNSQTYRSDLNNSVMGVVRFVVVVAILGGIGWSMRGGFGGPQLPNAEPTPVASNTVSVAATPAKPKAIIPAFSSSCSRLSSEECTWAQRFEKAISKVHLGNQPGESDEKMLTRMTTEIETFRGDVRMLPVTPPKFTKFVELVLYGIDHADLGQQFERSYLKTGNEKDYDQYRAHYLETAVAFNEASKLWDSAVL